MRCWAASCVRACVRVTLVWWWWWQWRWRVTSSKISLRRTEGPASPWSLMALPLSSRLSASRHEGPRLRVRVARVLGGDGARAPWVWASPGVLAQPGPQLATGIALFGRKPTLRHVWNLTATTGRWSLLPTHSPLLHCPRQATARVRGRSSSTIWRIPCTGTAPGWPAGAPSRQGVVSPPARAGRRGLDGVVHACAPSLSPTPLLFPGALGCQSSDRRA